MAVKYLESALNGVREHGEKDDNENGDYCMSAV